MTVHKGIGKLGQRTSATCPVYLCSPDCQPDVSAALHTLARWRQFGWHAIAHDDRTLDSVAWMDAELNAAQSYVARRARKRAEAARKK